MVCLGRTRGGRMEGSDKSTELWRYPHEICYTHLNLNCTAPNIQSCRQGKKVLINWPQDGQEVQDQGQGAEHLGEHQGAGPVQVQGVSGVSQSVQTL